MMATLFPNRKRKELKCKFKYEEKHHPALIEIALKASAAPLGTHAFDFFSILPLGILTLSCHSQIVRWLV